jgi:hypothetical protein
LSDVLELAQQLALLVRKVTGVSTTTRQNRSPRAPPRTGFHALVAQPEDTPRLCLEGILSDT